MSQIDRVSQVADWLEQSILSGELATGAELPSEREISSQLGVSRTVVREALGRLSSLGLVRSIHGSGTRVEAPSSRQVALGYQRLLRRPDVKLEHLAAIRLPLETAIASLAAVERTDDHLVQLEKAQKVLANPRRTLESHVKADVAFHAILADATGNPLFQVVLEPIAELLSESRRQTLEHYGAELAHRHHEKILEAVRQRDREAAAQAMREHIDANYRHLAELAEIAPTPAVE
jgi:DNA-binding FadR family transcriptional regulator